MMVLAMFFFDQVLSIPYAYKTLLKIVVFISLPITYSKYFAKKPIKYLPSLKNFGVYDLKKVVGLGVFTFSVVLGAYFILRQFIDLANIAAELSKIGVTPINFVFIAAYVTFFNSFIEEFFFRGYVFLNLLEEKKRYEAYLTSSLLFALYHIGIFYTWFSHAITLVALLGLFFGGIIFNWLNHKSKNITNSWLVHVAADASVIIVGLIVFGFI